MIYYISTVENNIDRLTVEDENGNSFLLCEEETPFPYSTVTIGNQVWTSENIIFDDGGDDIYKRTNYTIQGINFGTVCWYKPSALARIEQLYYDYRIPTIDDIEELKSFVNNNCEGLRSTDGWYGTPGTDELGFDGKPFGYTNKIVYIDDVCSFYANNKIVNLNTNNTITYSNIDNSYFYNVRLIKR